MGSLKKEHSTTTGTHNCFNFQNKNLKFNWQILIIILCCNLLQQLPLPLGISDEHIYSRKYRTP